MAGHHDLALVATQLDAWLREEDPQSVAELVRILRMAAERMNQALEPFESRWPTPPPGLRPAAIDPVSRGAYADAIRERIEELGSLSSNDDLGTRDSGRAYRVVHSMKAVAGAFGDDITAWYCHHLESFIGGPEWAALGLAERCDALASHYTNLCRLLLPPSEGTLGFSGLDTRPEGLSLLSQRTTTTRSSSRPSSIPTAETAAALEDPSVRVSGATMTHLFDHLQRVDLTAEELSHTRHTAERMMRSLSELRHDLAEISRLMGPPKPWSASAHTLQRLDASVGRAATLLTEAERVAHGCSRSADTLRSEWHEMHRELWTLQRIHLGWLFSRIEQAATRYAKAAGKSVVVEFRGGDLTLDRSTGERLLEPLLQIVRNAISHGIESPEQRSALGKPSAGLLRFVGERDGDWMRFVIEDDGSGIDLARVRQRAVSQGLIGREAGALLTDAEAYALVFVPGFSMQSDADLLAGRGVGLELAEQVIDGLGGEIHVTNRASGGVRLVIELPGERGLVNVVWLKERSRRFALPVAFAGKVSRAEGASRAPSLSQLVGLPRTDHCRWEMEILVPLAEPRRVGVDDLGDVEEVLVRPIPRLLSVAGPYVGVVLGGDGSLSFVLDAPRIADRCREANFSRT